MKTSVFGPHPLSEEGALDPRAAQEKLVEAFGEPNMSASLEGETKPIRHDIDFIGPKRPQEAETGAVVTLSEGEDVPVFDNPFAKEAAEIVFIRKIEALLFASSKPLSEKMLAERVPGADIPTILARLEEHYEQRAINLRCVDGKWQFVTAPDVASVLVEERKQERKLSRAALETLSIIAYHQPCSRADIEEVRGVAVAKGSLDQLLELGWVKIKGRREVPGRPLVYGTTPSFLEHFGLANLSDLPGLADLKAAGLLDARLPPGFSVPTPISEDDETENPLMAEAEEKPFVEDYIENDDIEDEPPADS
ncbi:MAG: SMC-Scp complex subunit ScpB [Pseudomonadota bacterium]